VTVDAERERRIALWRSLSQQDRDALEPSHLRALGVYGGAQGIWVDKANTAMSDEAPAGITVSILHTGRHYDDDVSEDCVLYHYPSTARPASRDAGEVQATKNAMLLRIPLFVVLPSPRSKRLRSVKLGWVSDFDDEGRTFLILYGSGDAPEHPTPYVTPDTGDAPFVGADHTRGRTSSSRTSRRNQPQFRFQILRQFGHQCAVCAIRHPRLLIAAHIRGVEDNGSDDWRNGIPLCGTHHNAFDAFLFGIDPETLALRTREGVSASDIGLGSTRLQPVRNRPHPDALRWRWEKTLEQWEKD